MRANGRQGFRRSKNVLLHPLRTDLHPLQGSGLVSRKGPERFSVRHVQDSLRLGHGDADLAAVWQEADLRAQEMGHRTADSRRGAKGAYRQARYADDGRAADYRRSYHLDIVMGEALRTLHLD